MTLESTCMAIIWKNGEWLHEVLCTSGPKIKALKRALKIGLEIIEIMLKISL